MKTLVPSQARKLIASAGIAVILTGASIAVSAAPKTVILAIPSMDCPVCPITVKKALSQVPGVSQTDVNFGKRQAVVTFDDAKINVGALTESTKNAGYPSTLVGTAN
ncbi:MAG: mercury resistance system periplasmic binding protein MerP [Rhodoferax sp.]|uniref:mercury resistance system periplasmic binding protein MerP n=1 Tax=Rhodoferax sp. TaxID=50421 RepID=UPI00179A3116|nr:mercury resistance system periplasmic binding protein MerP [Rhodoferax sp.]NMM19804.1 mercury resistance system periplasmic binding protein MerP [Rhodoferax sp.]